MQEENIPAFHERVISKFVDRDLIVVGWFFLFSRCTLKKKKRKVFAAGSLMIEWCNLSYFLEDSWNSTENSD